MLSTVTPSNALALVGVSFFAEPRVPNVDDRRGVGCDLSKSGPASDVVLGYVRIFPLLVFVFFATDVVVPDFPVGELVTRELKPPFPLGR